MRNPYFTYRHGIDSSLEENVKDPVFRAAVYLASHSLYTELEKNRFAIAGLPDKARLSAEKYLNRMTYRSTPFGLFSSFSVLNWEQGSRQVTIRGDEHLLHLSPDFKTTLNLFGQYQERLAPESLLLASPSIYPVNNEFRFFKYQEMPDGKRSFAIQQIEKNRAIKKIIDFCSTARSFNRVLRLICVQTRMDEESAQDLLNELINGQLLLTKLEPNITGRLFYERLSDKFIADRPGMLPGHKAIGELLATLRSLNYREAIRQLPRATENIRGADCNISYYANLEKKATGCPSVHYQTVLQEAITVLKKLALKTESNHLNSFKRSFIEKFDGQVIPLLNALDPETGISYGGLARPAAFTPVYDIKNPEPGDGNSSIQWTTIHQLLLNKLLHQPGRVIALTDEDISQLPGQEGANLPPSFPVIFKVHGQQLYVEQAGGASANALLGRFTLWNEKMLANSRAIARMEAQANPSVHFAAVAHISDAHTANINQRGHIRDYEIPLLAGTAVSDTATIKLADLFVEVKNNEVLLWSSKLDKPIIPRLDSAFNYHRDDLAIFRFLCDLQYQGLQASLGLDLPGFFPGLNFYPRVEYQQCIFSLATWNLTAADLKQLYTLPMALQIDRFKALAASIGLPPVFALTNADQYLVFDLDLPESIQLFLSEVKQLPVLTLKEVLMEPAQGGAVTDDSGDTFAHEFLAFAINSVASYATHYFKPKLPSKTGGNRDFVLGSEWLYFKIYCHFFNADEILLLVAGKMAQLQKAGYVHQWFFVRYQDPASHLRIRLHIEKKDIGSVLRELHPLLDKLQKRKKITGLQTATYERELERYSPGLMSLAEDLFAASTQVVIDHLKKPAAGPDKTENYLAALRWADWLLTFFVPRETERILFIEQTRNALFKEMGGTRALKIELDKQSRALQKEVFMALNDPGAGSRFLQQKEVLTAVLNAIKKINKQPPLTLTSDFIHMHINRLFADDQRAHELLVYTLLYRYETAEQSKKRN